MPEWLPQVMQIAGTILGAGAVTAFVNGWNKRQDKAQDVKAEDRKDTVAILREALQEERADHRSCLERVTTVEAAMFREREEAMRERARCAKVEERAEELEAQVEDLRALALRTYAESVPPDRQDPLFLAKLQRGSVPRMVEVVDPVRRKD